MYIKPEFELVEIDEEILLTSYEPGDETEDYELGPHEVDIIPEENLQ